MDLEVDIVREGEDALRDEDEDEYGDADGDAAEEEFAQPIADAAIDLAAGARYTATGKRKTAVARVILKPGTGAYRSTAARSTSSSRAPRCSARSAPRSRPSGSRRRSTSSRRCTAAASRPRPAPCATAISQGARRRRPEPALRAQAPRLPDARRARQGAQEGRPEEGPQAAAVLEALIAAGTTDLARQLFGTDGVRGVAGEFLTAELVAGARPRRDAARRRRRDRACS